MSTSRINQSSSSFNEAGPSKKRRLPGACDTCKKRKIRCDSGERPNGQCTNCVNAGIECTHVELTKNLGSAKGYVESLESRLEKMEQLIKNLLPGVDINNEIEKDTLEVPHEEPSELPRNDVEEVGYKLEKLSMDTPYKRYYGKASGLHLVETAIQHKEHNTGKEVPVIPIKKDDSYWEPKPAGTVFEEKIPNYTFPEPDLLWHLINLYFKHVNILLPLLHRPSFERSVQDGEHIRDHLFAGVLLLVCANGARFSDDPRVLFEPSAPNSAGWSYISQVQVVRQPMVKPNLLELQQYALAVPWFKAYTYSFSGWTQLGMGIRMAQDVGAHLKRASKGPNSMDEQWKRAFFVMLYDERTYAAYMGRPPCIHDEDYNQDYPLEVDDEYWDNLDPATRFKQPSGTPSTLAYFIHAVKLSDIMSYAHRTVYAIRKPNAVTGKPCVSSEQQLVSDLDSAMNRWLEAVPQHLKWDPKIEDDVFFQQSAVLHASYHHLQIFIHKPFIPNPHSPSSLSFPSLTICTRAARACSHVARAVLARGDVVTFQHMLICVFTAGVVLMLNTWTGKRSGFASNPDKDVADIQVCMDYLKRFQERWPSAGRLGDLLRELAAVSQVRIPGQKRRRSNDDLKQEVGHKPPSSSGPDQPRAIAGSRRASAFNNNSSSSSGSSGGYMTGSQYGLSGFHPTNSPELLNFAGDFSTPSSTSSGSVSGNSPTSLPLSNGLTNGTNFDLPEFTTGYNLPAASSQDSDFDSLLASLPSANLMNPLMPVWSATPFGHEIQDWATYLSNFTPTANPPTYQFQKDTDLQRAQHFWQ